MKFSETTTRVLVAAVGIPVGVSVVFLGGWSLAALLMLVAVLAALEFFRFAERNDVRPLKVLGAVLAALFVLLAALDPSRG
ncbi:MAG: phosphatidate cytidylyltransferase, partial [Gemmatimonadota bacterium]